MSKVLAARETLHACQRWSQAHSAALQRLPPLSETVVLCLCSVSSALINPAAWQGHPPTRYRGSCTAYSLAQNCPTGSPRVVNSWLMDSSHLYLLGSLPFSLQVHAPFPTSHCHLPPSPTSAIAAHHLLPSGSLGLPFTPWPSASWCCQ